MFVRPRISKHREPMRLQFGGPSRGEGWTRVGLAPDERPDLWLSPSDLHVFPPGSVIAIAVDSGFERLRPAEARTALAEWRRVLADEGELSIEFPDLESCLAVLGRSRNARGVDPAVETLFGQDARWGWTRSAVQEELESSGFGSIGFEPARDRSRPRVVRVRARKTSPSATPDASRSTIPSSALDLLS